MDGDASLNSNHIEENAEGVDSSRNLAAQRVRQYLSEQENLRASDEMVQRYIRAVGGRDARKAAKRLKLTLEWYQHENIESLMCPACPRVKSSHYMQCVCFDRFDRPTIYSCLELATNKDIEDNRRHMVATFETAVLLMGQNVSQWNWILDFHGFGIRDCDPRLAKIFLNMAAEHYPERLGHFFVIDAPTLFSSLFKTIRPLIDPKTAKKILFLKLNNENAIHKHMGKYYEADVLDWLVAEMRDNRIKRNPGDKVYDYEALANAVLEKKDVSNQNGCHNHLCGPGFLERVNSLDSAMERIKQYLH
eukprot:jgi/Picsp_1/6842/NSC_04179-R1_protein